MQEAGSTGASSAADSSEGIAENGADMAQHEVDLKAMSDEVCSLQNLSLPPW